MVFSPVEGVYHSEITSSRKQSPSLHEFLLKLVLPDLPRRVVAKKGVGPGRSMCCHLVLCDEWTEHRVNGEIVYGSPLPAAGPSMLSQVVVKSCLLEEVFCKS